MSLKQYLSTFAIGTAAALSAWCVVLIAINPLASGAVALLIFYITLGLGLVGVFTILGTSIRALRSKHVMLNAVVARSLRQAVFLTALVLLCLYLMTKGLLTTLAVIMAVVALGFLEFFFLVSDTDTKNVEPT
jgi:hypothetical protein